MELREVRSFKVGGLKYVPRMLNVASEAVFVKLVYIEGPLLLAA